jgi:hypothetical protein
MFLNLCAKSHQVSAEVAISLPRTWKEANKMDATNDNQLWQEAIKWELTRLMNTTRK